MHKKAALAIAGLLLISPILASAQQVATIEALEAQIQAMMVQLQALTQGTSGTPAVQTTQDLPDDYQGEQNSAPSCPRLTITMQKGSRDSTTLGQVRELQIFLTDYYNLDENILVGGYFGNLTHQYVVQFQTEQGLPSYGIVGSMTRAKIAEVCGGVPPVSPSTAPVGASANLGTIQIRAIVANINEVGDKYGSYGMKFGQDAITGVNQGLQNLKQYVEQSSYGKASISWTTSGVYELGSGVCNHTAYGDKVNDLIGRALQAADTQSPLTDYSYFLIVHPLPDCPDGLQWTYEGRGSFMPYTVNGRVLNLRGVHISDLWDFYLFHEFGHSLGYQANKGLGHPDYFLCPTATEGGIATISLSSSCQRISGPTSNEVPAFTIMAAKLGVMSDYSAVEKEKIGWLSSSDIVTTTGGQYMLSAIEQPGSSPKALKIPIAGTSYTVYVSFRQPIGYTYPAAPQNKPNGVILEIVGEPGITSLLVNNATNKDAPLQVGIPYRLGTNGPFVTVNSISGITASVTVSATAPATTTDLCHNIAGIQTSTTQYPLVQNGVCQCATGALVNITTGACESVLPPTDLCPNINGGQTTVPTGYTRDGTGNCVSSLNYSLSDVRATLSPLAYGDLHSIISGVLSVRNTSSGAVSIGASNGCGLFSDFLLSDSMRRDITNDYRAIQACTMHAPPPVIIQAGDTLRAPLSFRLSRYLPPGAYSLTVGVFFAASSTVQAEFVVTDDAVDVVDLCLNMTGTQATVPSGYTRDSSGNCALTPTTTASTTKLVAVGAYTGSNHTNGRSSITVNVAAGTSPLILSLSAYDPVDWTIVNPTGRTIQKVIASGYHSQTVTGQGTTPTETFSYDQGNGYAYAYSNPSTSYTNLANFLKVKTGLDVSEFQGTYWGASFTAPSTPLSSTTSISNLAAALAALEALLKSWGAQLGR